jgi:hypothetical protein
MDEQVAFLQGWALGFIAGSLLAWRIVGWWHSRRRYPGPSR